MSDNFEQRANRLQARIKRLKQAAAKPAEEHPKQSSEHPHPSRLPVEQARDVIATAEEWNYHAGWLRRTCAKLNSVLLKIGAVASVVWEHSGPVRKIISPVVKWVTAKYLQFFNWAAYDRSDNPQTRSFNKYKATVVVLLTALVPFGIWYGTKPVLTTGQQLVMACIAEKEAYTYFHGSETIEEGSLYSVKTTSRVPSTPESTTHMHVQQDLIYWLWYPEDIANAVPNEVAWGRVKYTGWRVKLLGWFPQVKDVEAIPLSELPEDHPAKSGNYHISYQQLRQAEHDGVILPGTDLSAALAR